jgi:hypothetical protein
MKILLFLFILVWKCSSSNSGYKSTIHVKLERTIYKTGFHRELNITLRFFDIPKKNCELNILQEVSPSWYISDDEYENKRRFSIDLPEIHYLQEKFDIEKPSWKSSTKQILFTSVLKDLLYSIVIPIHLRYQKPSLDKKFRKVLIKKPR